MSEVSSQSEDHREVGLNQLPDGVTARISRLEITGADRRRLMDLGFVPGAQVALEMENPLGDPRAFRVMGGVVAIRREQAEQIKAVYSEAE